MERSTAGGEKNRLLGGIRAVPEKWWLEKKTSKSAWNAAHTSGHAVSIQVLYFYNTDNPTFTPSLNWSALWKVWSEHLRPYFSVPFVTQQFEQRLSCVQANTTRRLLPSTDKMSILIPIHTKMAFSLSMTADFTLHYTKSSKLEQQ